MESSNPFDKLEEIKGHADDVAKEIVCKNEKLLEMQRKLEEKERILQEHIEGAQEMKKIKKLNEKLKQALASERIEEENKIPMQKLELENIKEENEKLKCELLESRIHSDEKLAESKRLVAELAEEVVNKNRKLWEMERVLGKEEGMLQKPIQGAEEMPRIKRENEKLNYALALQRLRYQRQKLELQSIKEDNEELKSELMENRIHFEEKLSDSKRLVVDLSNEMANKNAKLLEMELKLEENERKLHEHIQGEEEMQRVKEENKMLKRDLASRKAEEGKRKLQLQSIKEEKEKPNRKLISQNLNVSDCSVTDLVTELREMLAEKDEELHDMESLNQTLILRERMNNNELQDARKELINVLPDILAATTIIGLKRLGEVAQKPFQDACLQRFPIRSWGLKSATLSSLWQDKVNNPAWHPFKQVTKDGKLQETIDEDDSQLKELRKAWGEEAYNAVVNALLELNEHNPSGRYIVSELWNFEKERKATLKEVIQCLIQQMEASKSLKRKRRQD